MASIYQAELNKLKKIQKDLERFQLLAIENFEKWEDDQIQHVLEYFRKSNETSEDETSKLNVRKVLEKLKFVRKAVVQESGNNIPDLTIFQEDLVDIMNTIQDIKINSQLKLQELHSEETGLSEEVKFFNERLNEWSEPVKIDLKKYEARPKLNSSNNVPKDVKIFMDFVKASNGHENGWAPNDHLLFIKLKKKFKTIDDTASHLNDILPDISIEEIKKHDAWYVKYLSLKEKQNEAIKEWQQSRESNKSDNVNVIVDQCNSIEEMTKNPIGYIESAEKMATERKKVKDEIDTWKKEREITERIQRELILENIKQNKIKEKKFEEINKMKSERVKQWKAEKIALDEKLKHNEIVKSNIESNVKASVANKMIKLYQKQDNAIMEKKKNTKTTKTDEVVFKKPKNRCHIDRDPKRLFRPTQQWIHRFIANNNQNNSDKPVNFISYVPKLQTPSWRKDL